ncbi:MAG: NADH-quinone oxidoreductase subunit J [Geminicoccaceae bacterium]
MSLPVFVFYLFGAITVASAVMVISSRNPVHSVLFLILAFFTSAGLFVLIGAEFIAMILVVVYVGAVAVLFMFVVMMLDIYAVRMRQGLLHYLPIGALVGVILLVELILVFATWAVDPGSMAVPADIAPPIEQRTNTAAIGDILYTDYFYLFQLAGLILLTAIIGAITLTLRKREGVRRQDIGEQVAVTREQRLQVRKVSTGSGV